MKTQSVLATLFLIFCLSQNTFGQATSDEQAAIQQKAMQSFMEPGHMHKILSQYDGEWDEEISMWMDPAASPVVNKATCVNTMIMGNRYQQSVHHGEFNGMPFEGMSIWGFNNGTKMMESIWIDNMGTSIMFTEGRWDEKTMTANFRGKATDPVTGRPVTVREIVRFIDIDNQTMEMFEIKEGKENRTMAIKFTRKK